jgi:hypothetical protein
VDVAVDALLELVDGIEPRQIEKLGFQGAEEAFHCGVVQAVSFPGHALSDLPPASWCR